VFACLNLSMFYLCALWLWTNWIFWRAGRGLVARGITASSVAQRRAGAAVFGLLDEMRSASRVWTVNHGVRAVTTVAMAEMRLQLFSEQPHFRDYHFAFAAVLFLAVLSTAAAPGYVTTDFYLEVQTKLAAVADHTDDDGDGGGSCEELGSPPPKDTPTALMQRIAAAGSGAGMHFAGIPMTVEKAVTVATVVFYVTEHLATPACLTEPPPWWNGTAVVHAHL
jgi:hypothetical protein